MVFAIALDIGGTKIETALFDHNYKIHGKERLYFKKDSSESTVNLKKKDVLNLVCNAIDIFYTDNKYQSKIYGIGISIPDVIDKKGSIVGTSKIDALSNFALGKYLRKKYNCKVRVNNDADCFALGEAKLGAGKGHFNVIGVIWGTGIGAGIVLNKKMYSGTTGSAGEFGHNIIDPRRPKERNGTRGTVEAFCGGPNIVKNYKSAGGKLKNPEPKEIFLSKEKSAKKMMDNAIKHLCIGLASLMNILNPGIIVIGGGLSNLPVYKQLNKETRKYTIDGIRKHVRIVKNKLGDSAGIYGAAVNIFDK